MIKESTVLIFGAGVSSEYDFPLGRNLLFEIVEGIANKGQDSLFQHLRNENFKEELVDEFARSLNDSPWDSVDVFLMNRPEFAEIGRYAIALSLIPSENWPRLSSYRGPDGPHLYEYIFNKIGTSRDDFFNHQLSIVTFNYDRSFEEYCYRSIKAGFGLSSEKASELLRAIAIDHIYGKLAPTMYEDKEHGRYYSPDIKRDKVKQAVDAIKLISDNVPNDDLQPSTRLIKQAKRICFLGFSYHPTNLMNLGVQHWARPDYFASGELPEICGTAFDPELAEVEEVEDAFPGKISLGGVSEKSLQYLRSNSILK